MGIPFPACIEHSWGARYTRACTRMHTYPRTLVTGWRSTAPSSNREPNVSLCFDWSPPDHGPCCPFRLWSSDSPGFSAWFPRRDPRHFIATFRNPTTTPRHVYLSGVNVDRSCRQGWQEAIFLVTFSYVSIRVASMVRNIEIFRMRTIVEKRSREWR